MAKRRGSKATNVLIGASFKWSGTNELKKLFNEYASQLGPTGTSEMRERLKDVLLPHAELVRDLAKSRAPVQTGRLRGAIVAEKAPVGKPGVNIRVKKSSKEGGAWYARLVEKGTVKMAARPFFNPAIRAARPQIVPMISKDIKALIEEMAERLGYKGGPPK